MDERQLPPSELRTLFANWQKRNILGAYCRDKKEAVQEALGLIPLSAKVGISGSRTLEQLGLVSLLEQRGNFIFNQYRSAVRQESLAIRREGAAADYFLASANAVAESGELVFLSGYGNRTAGIAYARHAIVICGINKVVPTLSEALSRARQQATPLNCRRLNWESFCFKHGSCQEQLCLFPEYKRMCCQLLVIEAEVSVGRLKVILVGEALGF